MIFIFCSQNYVLKSGGFLIRRIKANEETLWLHVLPCYCAICWNRAFRGTCAATGTSSSQLVYHPSALGLSCKTCQSPLPSVSLKNPACSWAAELFIQSSEGDSLFPTTHSASDQNQIMSWLEILFSIFWKPCCVKMRSCASVESSSR